MGHAPPTGATGLEPPGQRARRSTPSRGLLPGPVLFARYAYPPNALGYCGPGDPAELLGMAAEGADLVGLSQKATQFEGAWPYLELIAGSNGIGEPLDRRVVEAYWTGNELVTRVPTSALIASLDDRFARRAGPLLAPLTEAAPGGVPQHNFHVFAVYPWLGLLRAGMEGPPLEVLDRCRIRWGRVEAVAGDLVTVRSRPLCFDGSNLVLGGEQTECVRHRRDGMAASPALQRGDVVSLHWDWVCDRLSPAALGWLRYCTWRNLDAVNALSRPGPAAVCDV
jgi:hypothetical protein